MSHGAKTLWIVKKADGLLKGPYSTEDILKRIRRGDFSGEEKISHYPGANWYPISQEPEFYDHLLEAISGKVGVSEDTGNMAPLTSITPVESSPTSAKKVTIIKPDSSLKSRVEEHSESTLDLDKLTRTPRRVKEKSDPEDIELVDIRRKITKNRFRSSWKQVLFISIMIISGVILLLSEDEAVEERIHLLRPQFSQVDKASIENSKSNLISGVSEFTKDIFSGYLKAQNHFVSSVEASAQNTEAMALLCMTYFELWPFAFQDSEDLKTVSTIVQRVSQIDGSGIHGSTCKAVDLLLKGRVDEARSLSQSVIDSFGAQPQSVIPFYYFMGVIAEVRNDLRAAESFYRTNQNIWGAWVRNLVLQGKILVRLEAYSEAAEIFRRVLKVQPGHVDAMVELGLIEFKQFRNLKKSKELLKLALQSKEKLTKKIISRGYLGLGEIALQEGSTKEALDYSRRAYQSDSTNSVAKNLMVQLGGTGEINKTRFKSYQLISEGDQFFREGDCNAAQAHYKMAYEIDKKSGVAAKKAAECLWKMSLSTEAIEWMNKAIRADSHLIEAYVLLADYFSKRFNFVAAAQILIGAQKVAPQSYEVFRGFAIVELRRNNLKAAIDYAKKGLSLYGTDVESLVVSSQAHAGLGQFQEAFADANRARELDPNHIMAQVSYGRSLAGIRGTEAAFDYFNELVKTFPLVNEYRLGLARQLITDERFADAESVLVELTHIEEKSKEGLILLGNVQKAQTKLKEALESYDRAAIIDPSDAEPIFLSGVLLLEANKPNEAQIQFQRVLRINKLYPLVHYQLGRTALALNDPATALKESKEERTLNPNLADAYLLAAEAYSLQQQFSLCVSEYQKAIRLRPQSAFIYIKMAICYRKSDQLDVAISMLNQAAVQESGMPEIYRELGQIYEIKGEMAQAAKAYQQYFVLNPNAADRALIEQRFRGSKSF